MPNGVWEMGSWINDELSFEKLGDLYSGALQAQWCAALHYCRDIPFRAKSHLRRHVLCDVQEGMLLWCFSSMHLPGLDLRSELRRELGRRYGSQMKSAKTALNARAFPRRSVNPAAYFGGFFYRRPG